MKSLIILLMLLSATSVFGEAKKVAVVKIVRGDVDILTLGKTSKLKKEDWVEDGAVVKTADKSFVKLVFVDKSQMNVGPNSEMKIEKFSGNDSGVIDLVKGKIRSQVTKDYLQMKDKDKSKLFIKTPNAVMGIRGTDFMISTNGKNTAAVLFEGSVVFNRIESRGVSSTDKLEDMVNKGVRMHPGEFSVVDHSRTQPTVPARLNVQQIESLEKNETFDSRSPSASTDEAKKSVVPAGLTGTTVSNDSKSLNKEMGQIAGASIGSNSGSLADANGYVKGDEVKPANGSFVHIETGIIIPPGSDSVLDPVTNSYIPGPQSGTVSIDGAYVPPANVEITPDGKIMVSTTGTNGQTVVTEAPAPTVVKVEAPSTTTTTAGSTTTLAPTKIEPPKDIFMIPGATSPIAAPAPTGGIPDIGQAVQQNSTGSRLRTIHVNN